MELNDLKQLVLAGKRVLVVGLGSSGIGAVQLLLRCRSAVTVTESRNMADIPDDTRAWLAARGVVLEAGGHSPGLFLHADLIVVSPGVPLSITCLQHAFAAGIPVVSEASLAGAFLDMPMVAVTGTNGKSTVVTLLGTMFENWGKKVFVGGNLGDSLAGFAAAGGEADVVVAEMSSYQLDLPPFPAPRVAVLLNISPDHLDRYDDYGAYVSSKFNLFRGQVAGQKAVLNCENKEIGDFFDHLEETGQRRTAMPAEIFFFGRRNRFAPAAEIAGTTVTVGQTVYELAGTYFERSPNRENAAAAILAAGLIGCPEGAINKALATYSPLPHRLSPVAEIAGVRYVDDSKATNIGAAMAALQAMAAPVVLIAGGRDKGGEYAPMVGLVAEKVHTLVLIGEARAKMAAAFGGVTTVKNAATMAEAVAIAAAAARPGDCVLLAPACASFDMFTSYSQRGKVFQDAVKTVVSTQKSDE